MTSNGQRHPMQTPRTCTVDCFSLLVGGGSNQPLTIGDSGINGGGEITAVVRNSAGSFTVTFAKSWPQVIQYPVASFIDATASNIAGLECTCTAFDPVGKTATLFFSQNSTSGVDPATTTSIALRWAVRYTNKN